MTAPQDPFSTPPQGGPGDSPAGYGTPGAQPDGYGAQPGDYGSPPPGYGAPAYGQQPAPYGAPGGFGGHPAPRNGFGIAALVLGILSIPAGFTVVFGILLGVLAIIFGALGRGRAKKGLASNGGMALTGLILGVVGLLISIAVAAAFGAVLGKADFGGYADCLEQAGSDQAAAQECAEEFQSEFEDSVNR